MSFDVTGTGRGTRHGEQIGIRRYTITLGDHHPPWSYKSFAGRLESFDRILPDGKRFKWNNPFVTPYDLAQTGFFAVGEGDMVECAFCSVGLHMFVKGKLLYFLAIRLNVKKTRF